MMLPAVFARKVAFKLFGERVPAWEDATRRKLISQLRTAGRVITPIDSALSTLQLKGLLPSRLVALEPFGRMGYWKTLDYVDRCDELDFYEIHRPFASAARRHLPESVRVHCEDAFAAVCQRKTPRQDYNWVLLDNGIGEIYGADYCEHFEMIPKVFDLLAPRAIVVANVFRTTKPASAFDSAYVKRRATFYGLAEADAMQPTEDAIFGAYRSRLPAGRRLVDAFTVPHPRHPDVPLNDMHFVVLALG